MTVARKLTLVELHAWERFATDAYGARISRNADPRVAADVLAQYAAADADALLRQWRRRAGRETLEALRREQWRRDHGGKP